jgi:hypothetical protein
MNNSEEEGAPHVCLCSACWHYWHWGLDVGCWMLWEFQRNKSQILLVHTGCYWDSTAPPYQERGDELLPRYICFHFIPPAHSPSKFHLKKVPHDQMWSLTNEMENLWHRAVLLKPDEHMCLLEFWLVEIQVWGGAETLLFPNMAHIPGQVTPWG